MSMSEELSLFVIQPGNRPVLTLYSPLVQRFVPLFMMLWDTPRLFPDDWFYPEPQMSPKSPQSPQELSRSDDA